MFDPQYLKDFDQYFFTRCSWSRHRSLWPRRCWSSGQSLWLKRCYRASVTWNGPGEPITEARWFAEEVALWLLLTREK